MTDRDYVSATEIQDLLIARATSLNVFKSLFTTPMETWTPEDLPAIAVFLVSETMESLGNAGEPSFLHTVTYGIQAVVRCSNAEEQRKQITDILAQLDIAILTDPKTLMPIEQVARMSRLFKFETVAETPIAQFSSSIVINFRSTWPPYVPDDFRVLHVETRYPSPDVDPDAVQQVYATYDIDIVDTNLAAYLAGKGRLAADATVI